MSYKMMRVYKCSSCGKSEIGLKTYLNGSEWHLPTNWTGEQSRRGWCYCPSCWKRREEILKAVSE